MIDLPPSQIATLAVAALSTGGVILSPGRVPEATWAVLGGIALVVFGLMLPADALKAVSKGIDIYLFLIGMMLLAELARKEGLFDWLAAHAVRHAAGSPTRLFALVYVVGTIVTIFLSNDATAVVLTPAVYAAARAAKAKPLPYLLVCAFVANAASFVLPISNPANLVIFGAHMPSLTTWLARFAIPSGLAILATFIVLRWTQSKALEQAFDKTIDIPELPRGGYLAAFGIAATAVALLAASALQLDLGWPTCLAAFAALALVGLGKRSLPTDILTEVSWSVLPLVAGLFVLVEGLAQTGLLALLSKSLNEAAAAHQTATGWIAGSGIALLCNLMNNLPAGLVFGEAVNAAHVPEFVRSAILIGVNLGPNLSVTGSLATILWLNALRREGETVSAWTFLKLGALVMPPALLAALAGACFTH
ncbi:MAG: arsenic transporter [Hyphomicrobiaceae bacterium]